MFEAGKQIGTTSSSITSIEVDEDDEFEYSEADLSSLFDTVASIVESIKTKITAEKLYGPEISNTV